MMPKTRIEVSDSVRSITKANDSIAATEEERVSQKVRHEDSLEPVTLDRNSGDLTTQEV